MYLIPESGITAFGTVSNSGELYFYIVNYMFCTGKVSNKVIQWTCAISEEKASLVSYKMQCINGTCTGQTFYPNLPESNLNSPVTLIT